MRLENRVALVTGGARGIGAGIARCLAADGAAVAVVDLDGPAAKRLAADLGPGHVGLGGDAAERVDAGRFVDEVVARLGGLDILVNNAGAGRADPATVQFTPRGGTPLATMTQDEWDGQLAQNLGTTFVCSQAALPRLKARGGGSIVNIASIAGLRAGPSLPAYAAAKAAVVNLTQTMALEFAAHQVRVNAICPGLLWTRAWESMATAMQQTTPGLASREPRDIFLEIVERLTPLGREQTPEDIGRLAAFLCSDDARNITGQSISVDGGITLRG